jgi:UDP-2,4-diacetamido-2,4,6-trideoxy-beta-L-altropyranose hydrolase
MGIGHLMRCLTLAETLRGRGIQTRFICRAHKGHLLALLQQSAMPVTVLPASVSGNTLLSEDYSAWLGVTQAEDAEQSIEALDGEKPDWLVVDHYGLDAEWEQRLRPHTSKLMVIDDLANRRHDCDILLDQNYFSEGESRYTGLIPKTCKQLLGPRYALLRPEYAAYGKTMRARDGRVSRVLVFFGGSDSQNMTGLALEALSCAELCHLEVDVVIGTNNPHREALEKQSKERPQTTLWVSRPHLADLISQADLAIGAGGATTWERMCLGLPTVVISIAENQLPASVALADAKLIHYAGHFCNIKIDHLTQLLLNMIRSPERLTRLASQNQLKVDGFGALRLAEILSPSDIYQTRLRPAEFGDINFYFNLVNDPEVRKNSVDTCAIKWETHKKWFEKKKIDMKSRLFVFEVAGLPIGQIRFDKECDVALIDYSLDFIVRGRGWGSRLIKLGVEIMWQTDPVRLLAQVKAINELSVAVFRRLKFTETKCDVEGYKAFYLDPLESYKLK